MKSIDRFPHDVRVIENTWVPMPDGCRLAARIWLPADAELIPVPAILEYIPYRKRDFTRRRDDAIHYYFAGHGYAALRVDLRGSGDSDGLLLDEYSHQEHEDALEVIRWIAHQPWCTGKVGMMGKSWGGFNALQVAMRRPPELKAIITVCSTDDRYADDAHYMGGCLLNENLVWGSVMMSYIAYPPDPEIVGDRWRSMWRERLERLELFPAAWLEHSRRDDYWKHGSVCENFAAIACPVYAVGGWADAYSNAIPRLLAGLAVPRKGLIGPWAHLYPHEGVPGPAIGFLQEALRWWNHWLKGVDTGLMAEPMLRVWMQDSVPPKPYYENRPGRWVAECQWPSPRIKYKRLWLDGDRLCAAGAAPARLEIRSPQTTGLGAGAWSGYGVPGDAPLDQRADEAGSLTFDSEPLLERLEILGAPEVILEVGVDRPVALVAVCLSDVEPGGASYRVTYGVQNLTHRNGHERLEPIEPAKRYSIKIKLNDAAHCFASGHKLRLAVSTSYWPIVWPAPEPATVSIFTGASSIEIPVRPPDPDDALLRRFEPPERAAMESTELRPAEVMRSVEKDPTTDVTIYTIASGLNDLDGAEITRIKDINLEFGHMMHREFRIGDDNPNSAQTQCRQKTWFNREGWKIRVETRTRAVSSAQYFFLEAKLTAYENEELFFTRTWNRRIKRDLV